MYESALARIDAVATWLLARLKAVVAFLGAAGTFACTLDWGTTLPAWVAAAAAVLTFAGVYAVPNITPDYQPRRALPEGEDQ